VQTPPIPAPDSSVLVPRTTADRAASYVRTLIFDGYLKPGAHVPQDEIVAALGISRIPLREALITLEREGWVTIKVHHGAFVTPLNAHAVSDHFEIFGLIYGFAIEQALARSGDEFVARMEAIEHALAEAHDVSGERTLLFNMYTTIIDCAESPRLRVLLRGISSLVPGDFFSSVPGAVEIERRSLSAIVRALKRNDPDKAAAEFQKMLRAVAKEVTRLFEERGLLDHELDREQARA
jgi:DNA-binding GntR family transcriptional regulator